MQFTIDQKSLAENLGLVIRAIPNRPTHPILANVLVEANVENQILTLTGFDLNLAIVTAIPAQIDEGGKTTIPAKLLNDIVSKMSGDISFLLEDGKTQGKIKAGKSQYDISILNIDEYPALPAVRKDGVQSVKLSAETLLQGFKHTLFSISPDERKQILTGVNIKLNTDKIDFAATDGHRCSWFEIARHQEENSLPIETTGDKIDLTINGQGCSEISRILGKVKPDTIVELVFDESYLACKADGYFVLCRKLSGQYPKYSSLFPKQSTTTLTLDRKEFITALQRIAVVADQKNNIIKAALGENEILLTVDNAEAKGEEAVNVGIETSETEFKFAFNSKYLLAGLKEMESEEITMGLTDPIKPIVVTPASKVGKMQYLIMPIQTRS